MPGFNKNIFICRSSHFIKCFKNTSLKVLVYPESSLLENLYPEHKLLRRVAQANLSVDDRLPSTSKKRVECVLKAPWKRLEHVLTWKRLENVLKTSLQSVLKAFWRRLENVLARCLWICLEEVFKTFLQDALKTSGRRMTKANIFVLIKTSSKDVWPSRIYLSLSRRLEDVFWRGRRKTSSRRLHQDKRLLDYHLDMHLKKQLKTY